MASRERSISRINSTEVLPGNIYLLRGAHSTKAGLWFPDGRTTWHFFFRNAEGRYNYSRKGHGPKGEVSMKDQVIDSDALIHLIEARSAGAHIEATVEGEWQVGSDRTLEDVLGEISQRKTHRPAATAA